jgi:hypothetical protein
MGGQTLAEKGVGAPDIVQVQAGMSQILQRRGQIARGTEVAQEGRTLLIMGLRLGVLLLAVGQITKPLEGIRDPSGIARLTGQRQTLVQQGPSCLIIAQLNRCSSLYQ